MWLSSLDFSLFILQIDFKDLSVCEIIYIQL
jgi:hypothetical protein